ncbi:hypothetical protein [Leptodesmis sp.]|uniref:hypothetical protein n=1 Tax=Leptodesmis sp. TaxID=3100501 RepID=UPI0040534DA9
MHTAPPTAQYARPEPPVANLVIPATDSTLVSDPNSSESSKSETDRLSTPEVEFSASASYTSDPITISQLSFSFREGRVEPSKFN